MWLYINGLKTTILHLVKVTTIFKYALFGFLDLEYHYQKINKYKRKYRENIFIGKFSSDFTDRNIPSVYTEGITVEKKIKTK